MTTSEINQAEKDLQLSADVSSKNSRKQGQKSTPQKLYDSKEDLKLVSEIEMMNK